MSEIAIYGSCKGPYKTICTTLDFINITGAHSPQNVTIILIAKCCCCVTLTVISRAYHEPLFISRIQQIIEIFYHEYNSRKTTKILLYCVYQYSNHILRTFIIYHYHFPKRTNWWIGVFTEIRVIHILLSISINSKNRCLFQQQFRSPKTLSAVFVSRQNPT